MVHLLRTHSAISKKMVIIPNTPSNEEIEGGESIPLRDLDGSESSFPGLNRRQPVKCVGDAKLPIIVHAPAYDVIRTNHSLSPAAYKAKRFIVQLGRGCFDHRGHRCQVGNNSHIPNTRSYCPTCGHRCDQPQPKFLQRC